MKKKSFIGTTTGLEPTISTLFINHEWTKIVSDAFKILTKFWNYVYPTIPVKEAADLR